MVWLGYWLLTIGDSLQFVSPTSSAYTPVLSSLNSQKAAAAPLGSSVAVHTAGWLVPLVSAKRKTGQPRGGEVGPLVHKPRQLLNDCGAERFDQDELRKLRADGESRIADLADEIRLAGQQLDNLIFAQS